MKQNKSNNNNTKWMMNAVEPSGGTSFSIRIYLNLSGILILRRSRGHHFIANILIRILVLLLLLALRCFAVLARFGHIRLDILTVIIFVFADRVILVVAVGALLLLSLERLVIHQVIGQIVVGVVLRIRIALPVGIAAVRRLGV